MGDCASYRADGSDRPKPPRAQAVHQMAATVFDNLVRIQSGRPATPFVYRDHDSLVSLSRFSIVGSLMGVLVGGHMAIEGRLARFVYMLLYRMHLISIHGWIKGAALIAIIRLKLKPH